MESLPPARLTLRVHFRSFSRAVRVTAFPLFLLGTIGGSGDTEARTPASSPPLERQDSWSNSPSDCPIIYLSNFKSGSVQMFSSTGTGLGVFARVTYAIGVAFDQAGNLFVSSADPNGYSIQKFAPDGTGVIFATNGLNAPHGLAIDQDGSLYVANKQDSIIEKYTPEGVGSVFADAHDGLVQPVDLLFDASGNLFVTNAYGGATRNGSVEKFTPDGTGTLFADSRFSTAYGLAIDSAGNVYVSDFIGNTVLKFASDGTYLGVFASAPLNGPHGMFFDSDGNLYVASNGVGRIEKFSSTGSYLGVFANTGSGPHFFALYPPAPSPSPTPTPTATPTPVAPTISVQPENKTVLLGETATFSVTATGTEPLNYQWRKNDSDIPGAIESAYTTPPTVAVDNGSLFQLTVTNVAGSVTSNSATLTVNLPPTITTQPQSRVVAVGKSLRFTVAASGTAPLSYQWYRDGVAIPSATKNYYSTPPATPGDNGALFFVAVTNPYGSTSSITVKLRVR